MTLWAIIPVKSLREGKSRLNSVLSENERVRLNEKLLLKTLNCIKNIPQIIGYLVISRDSAVLDLASEYGAKTVQESQISDINYALNQATEAVKTFKATQVLVLPADLPYINHDEIVRLIERSGNPPEIIIASDHKQNGTNALLVNPLGILEYDFGLNSFVKHKKQAERKKIHIDVFDSDIFNFDLDLPEDLISMKESDPII